MAAAKEKTVEIKQEYGSTITVPANEVREYAGLKTEQLAVLTRLISDNAQGVSIEFDEDDVSTLLGLMSELAQLSNALVAALPDVPGAGEKGGA